MNLQKLIFTKSDCYKKGLTITPIGIVVHSTGANNSTLKRYVGPDDGMLGNNPNKNHWNQAGIDKCVHAFIGKLANGNIATYQTLPWNMRGWHAGSGSKGSANNGYIGFEICEDALKDKTYFDKVYKEAVELTAMLCKQYNIKPEKPHLICHSEANVLGIASAHKDVMHWFPLFGSSMDLFRKDVAKEIASAAEERPPVSPETLPLLKKGSKGENVKTLQKKLNEFGYKLTEDGDFGTGTETTLKDFQKKNGLTTDGVCGKLTWATLYKVSSRF
jgi:N-acetyl-anhydromuramyl-L-alanine amidase AmpD